VPVGQRLVAPGDHLNAGEAALITGRTIRGGRIALARLVATAIVTLGAEALWPPVAASYAHAGPARPGARSRAPDVFAAAYVWADLAGSPLAGGWRSRACMQLSLRAPSVLRGALDARLVRAADPRRADAAAVGA
jgi:hypothetical protein